ncbi:uridine kinase [Saccharopolyspora rhizosphaerae]|uniref:Uridine kinase n=1 Tax=Saccharopolyspora rhizosphaerae TaxID=2492662 RepID=A0A3R8P785_9PSEU|nr:uridine kinase [Saccharopolyspora rhizosphaerae]RRO18089.1 uridine kinase [Saccharopolyspora rhizosphaerae]
MRARPITPEALVTEVVERIDALAGRWLRVAVDGAPAARTGELADRLVSPLRERGREVVRVRAADYLRPASVRLEHGHRDPDSYYLSWFDTTGLAREVIAPLREDGTGKVLPALWDPEADRSPRLDRIALPERGVAVVDGPLLQGVGLDFDLVVHLWLSDAALRRTTPEDQRWTLPAFERYAEEVVPASLADLVVRVDHPDRPAVIDSVD